MRRPPEIKNLTSSGGVISRVSDKGVEAVLIAVRGRNAWCLPKGIIDKGEEPPATALREVKEETGLAGKIIEKIGGLEDARVLKIKGVRKILQERTPDQCIDRSGATRIIFENNFENNILVNYAIFST